MDIKDVLLTVFMVSILILAGLFIGDIIGQSVRGNELYLNDIELAILLSAIILCLEMFAIMLFRKKKEKEVDLSHYLKEARKEVY